MRVKLIKNYTRDIEWWLAYPADPRWTYHKPGEVLDVSAEEAQAMLDEGVAEPDVPPVE